MMSGDAPKHTNEISSKKVQYFFGDFNFGWTFQRLLHKVLSLFFILDKSFLFVY